MMKLRRNHQMTKPTYDPRYPLRGFRVVEDGPVWCWICQLPIDDDKCIGEPGKQLTVHLSCAGPKACEDLKHSFFALKHGEKGKHGVVGE